MSFAGGLLKRFFILLTASFVFLGAFSRFTHGIYTPRYYAYQEYHQPDDGGTAAKIVPIMDTVLGSMLLFRNTRVYAAITISLFMVIGLLVQISAGKRFEIDLVMIAVAMGSVFQAKALNRE